MGERVRLKHGRVVSRRDNYKRLFTSLQITRSPARGPAQMSPKEKDISEGKYDEKCFAPAQPVSSRKVRLSEAPGVARKVDGAPRIDMSLLLEIFLPEIQSEHRMAKQGQDRCELSGDAPDGTVLDVGFYRVQGQVKDLPGTMVTIHLIIGALT